MEVMLNSPNNNTTSPRGHKTFLVQVVFSRALRNVCKPMQLCDVLVAIDQGFSEDEATNDAFIINTHSHKAYAHCVLIVSQEIMIVLQYLLKVEVQEKVQIPPRYAIN